MWELFILEGEKKNVCKHVVESYTIYLKIIMQRDWKGEKYYVSMSGCKSFTFDDEGLDWFKYCTVFCSVLALLYNILFEVVFSPSC